MTANWKKETIGIYKKNVSAQFRAVRYIKFIYGLEINEYSKEKIASFIKEHFEKYRNIVDKDYIIKAFCRDNKKYSKKVRYILEEKVRKKLKEKSDRILGDIKERPFAKEEYIKKANEFYKSPEWRKVRYEVLREQKGKCQCCGRSAKDGVVLHVDHIIPLSKDWSKRLDKDNLQVLCEDCNLGKSNTDSIDWRRGFF